MTAPGEAPAPREAAPETADQTRQRLDTLRTDVLESNSRETRELVGALTSLQGYMSTRSKALESTKQRILQEIQAVMTILSTMEDLEKTPPADLSSKLQPLLTRLNDAEQHLFALFPDEKNNSEEANGLITALDTAFDEKRQAIQRLGPLDTLSSWVSRTPVAPAEAPEVPATPEQTAYDEAVDKDTDASNAISEKIRTLSENFEGQMQALKATIPDISVNIPFIESDDQARSARASIESIITKFKLDKEGIFDALALADNLRGEGKFVEAKGAMDTVRTKVDAMLAKAEPEIEAKLNDEGVKSDPKQVEILTNVKNLVATAKTELPPLLLARNTTLDGVATAKAALDQKGQQPLKETTEVLTLAQQAIVDPETPDSSTDTSGESGEKLTYTQFKEKINAAWEEVSEGLNKGDVAAIIAGALAMLTLAISQFNTIASGSLDFLSDLTGKKKETPEGAPEKPADVAQVLAQFGIDDETKQAAFAALKLSDVALFIQRDGTPQTDETLSPTLVTFNSEDNGTPYGRFKAQLELNNISAYVAALPADRKDTATLGEFIQSRVDNEQEGWKIA